MQAGTKIRLPGGALLDGALAREAEFRPLTGRLEEELAERAETEGGSRPARVSALLAAALAHVGGRAATPELVAGLATTDRQVLMLALALEHTENEQWRHITCAACSGRFDIGCHLSSLPLTPAAEGYPWTEIDAAGRRLRLRMPTGEDEARAAGLERAQARRALALACVAAIDGAAPQPAALEALGEAEIDA